MPGPPQVRTATLGCISCFEAPGKTRHHSPINLKATKSIRLCASSPINLKATILNRRLIGDGLGIWDGPAQAGGDLDGEGGDGFGGLGGGFMMGGGLDMADMGDGGMGGAGGDHEENPAHTVGWDR